MMTRDALCPLSLVVLVLAGCASPAPTVVAVALQPPATDALYVPARVVPGRLEYAPDRSTFAPVLTERIAYPTQPEANAAYQRYVALGPPDLRASSVRLFGCRPGALDPQTARVSSFHGVAVLCATDFLDPDGRTINALLRIEQF